MQVYRRACVEDSAVGAACLGCDTFETVEAKHTRQIMIALPTLTFSRSHHSALLNRGSEASASFGSGGRTEAWSKDGLCDLACREGGLLPDHIANLGRNSDSDTRTTASSGRASDARAYTPVVVLDAQPPRLSASAIGMQNGHRRIDLFRARMVNQSLHSRINANLKHRARMTERPGDLRRNGSLVANSR
jgi:hypothetical protein